MTKDRRELTITGIPQIKASTKWWRGMSGFRRSEAGIRGIITHAKYMCYQRRIQKKYGLGPGETLGV